MSNTSRSVFNCVFVAVAVLAASQPSSAAGNSQMPPSTFDPPPLPTTPQTLTSGYWRVDQGFVSTIEVKNAWVVSAIDVIPVLYFADGTPYPLPSVHLGASATKTISINQALSAVPGSVAAHESQFGSAALMYRGNVGAVIATVTLINPGASLSYVWPTQLATSAPGSVQTLEGLWWRRDDGVGGFVAISNSTQQPKQVTIQLVAEHGRQMQPEAVLLAPHATQTLDLDALTNVLPKGENRAGGLRLQFDGQIGDINVAGGLANWTEGYSAVMPFWTTMMPMGKSMPNTVQILSNVGLMVGAPDPMMAFPAGTRFVPYLAVRNTTAHELKLNLTFYLDNGKPLHAPAQHLNPFESKRVDMRRALSDAGLSTYNGTINVAVSYTGQNADIIEASGSVDQSGTYVFEVPARSVETSLSKETPYWSTANGADTMVTIWNPSSTPEDITMTLHFAGGSRRYTFPVHLAPYASSNLDLMQLIESRKPDKDGNIIPGGANEGSIVFASSKGENQAMNVVVNVGIFNVATATCTYGCLNCYAYYATFNTPNPVYCPVSESEGMVVWGRYYTGNYYGVSGSWVSSNPSVAPIQTGGWMTGAAVGTATFTATAFLPASMYYCAYNPSCSNANENFQSTNPTTVFTIQVYNGGTQIAKNQTVYISAAPQMPNIQAQLVGAASGTSVNWALQFTYQPGDGVSYNGNFSGSTNGSAMWTVPWSTSFVGGNGTFTATYNGVPATFPFVVQGTNPAATAIDSYIGGQSGPWFWPLIISEESAYQQFSGGKPLFGAPHGFGLSQVDPPPSVYDLWNWQQDLADGLAQLNSKQSGAFTFWSNQVNQWNTWNSAHPTLQASGAYSNAGGPCQFQFPDVGGTYDF